MFITSPTKRIRAKLSVMGYLYKPEKGSKSIHKLLKACSDSLIFSHGILLSG